MANVLCSYGYKEPRSYGHNAWAFCTWILDFSVGSPTHKLDVSHLCPGSSRAVALLWATLDEPHLGGGGQALAAAG